MTPAVRAVLELVAWRSSDPVTLWVVGELIARIVCARAPAEVYVATYDAVLYASGALRFTYYLITGPLS